MAKIKKGDEVKIIAGKDKNRKGTVIAVIDGGKKLLIEGLNTVKKNVKANPNTGEQGGITIKAMPIDRSNVMLYNTASDKATRVGLRILKDGRKERYYKDTGESVDALV